MEIGDLVKRKYQNPDGYQNIAYITGFDSDGDLEIRYLNPNPKRYGTSYGCADLDYKSSWELLDERDRRRTE